MEIVSGHMTPEQISEETHEIVALFKKLPVQDLVVWYGFGCDCEFDEQYQEIKVKTDDLLGFLSQIIASGVYLPGDADFFIESRPSGVQFLLCHESDVHLETGDEQAADHFRARWSARKDPGHEKQGTTWVPLSAAQRLPTQGE